MLAGVVGNQALGRRRGVQFPVRRNQGDRGESGAPVETINLSGGGELHGVISPQSMRPRQEFRIVQDLRRQLDHAIPLQEVASEVTEVCTSLGPREAPQVACE